VTELLESYSLSLADRAPDGWALRILVDGKVPPETVLEYFDRIKDSGVPPYQDSTAIRHVLKDITAFTSDWLNEVLRPGSKYAKSGFPAGIVEEMVDRYLLFFRSDASDPIRNRLLDIQSKVRSHF